MVGKIKQPSIHGENYLVTVADEFSRFVYAKPNKHESAGSETVVRYRKWFERQTESSVKDVRTDGGKEISRGSFQLDPDDVEIDFTSAYSPAPNGLVERTQGIILNATRILLSESKLPLKF